MQNKKEQKIVKNTGTVLKTKSKAANCKSDCNNKP